MSNELYVNDYNINGYLPPSQYPIAMSSSSLGYFLGKCTKSDFFKDIGNGFTQGLNFVNFIRIYPYNVMDTQYTETDVPIPIGNTSVTISQDTTLKRIVGTTKSKLHITKEFTIIKDITKFYESYPYTQVDCYLPYVGFTSLDINELKASNGKIKVDLVIDIVSGSGVYSISRYDTSLNGYYVFYTCTTNFATDVSIGGANSTEINKKLFNSTAQLGIMIGTTALSVASFSAGMTGVGMFSAFNGLQQGGNLLGNLPETMQQTLISRGQNGNFPSSINNPHAIYFIIKTRKINDYDSFKSVYGKPLNKSVNLSTLEGITFIPNPKLEIPNITNEEYNTLSSLMQNGIILKKTNTSLQLYNVKLGGKYSYYQLQISNVNLKGDYTEKHQLEISNVSLAGNYIYKPIIEVSNVSLQGQYYKSLDLSISNVSISGKYKFIEQNQINISNVKLSGSYNVYVDTTLNVSNVSLSGSYKVQEDNQINVSNVSLGGNYSIYNSGINVSNVKLKGSYIEYEDPTPSPTYYTVTVKLYKDNSLYSTKYLSYESGSTCNPNSLAISYQPTGYEIGSTSPTSSFSVYTTRTVYIYYVTPTPTYYDLTMYLYKDNSLYKTITNSYASGSTINPSSLAGSNCPSGYKVDSYSPSSSFTITSDTSLTIYYVAEVVTYTLTINLYKNLELYKTITQTLNSGTTVTPSSIASSNCPSGYEVQSYSPTSAFVISSNSIVNCYYTYPTLTKPTITYSQGTGTYKTKYMVRFDNPNSTNATIHYSGSDISSYSVNVNAGSFTYVYVDILSTTTRTYTAYFTKDGYGTSPTTTLKINPSA